MAANLYAKCSYFQQTYMFYVTENLLFDDLLHNVGSHFGLTPRSFNLHFSLPQYPSCALSNDVELKLMMQSMADCGVGSVDILVKDNFETNSVSMSTATSFEASTSLSTTLSSDFADFMDENDFLGSFRVEAPRSYLSNEWQTYISHVNQKFEGGAVEFRDKLRKFAIESGFAFEYVRNHKDKVIANCKIRSEGCLWSVCGKKKKGNDFFYIKKLIDKHTCKGVLRRQTSKHLGSHTVSSVISQGLKENPMMMPKEIIATMENSYGLDVDYHTACYLKNVAQRQLRGGDGASYSQLGWYRSAILKSNPRSSCYLETDPMTFRFERFFVCFAGCIEGFKSCLPTLFVDAAHLKNKYKGYMLCATGKNGNEEFYPFAFAVVRSENKDNWRWFFERLHEIVAPQGRTITFFSDRHEGLMDSLEEIFPDAPHSYCFFHLTKNLLKCYEKQKGNYDMAQIMHDFMAVAYSPTEASYKYNLSKLLNVGGQPIRNLVNKLDVEKWCCAYFKGNRYGEMSNSVAESFNGWTKQWRELPIFEMLEMLRVKLMKNMSDRKVEASRWTTRLCHKVEHHLREVMKIGRHWSVSMSSPTVFEVHSEKTVTVDLENRSCSCHQWQINSFPCSHALVPIQQLGSVSVYDYIENYSTVESYKSAYEYGIQPIPNIEKFYEECINEHLVVNPPITRVPSGRPRVSRIKGSVEQECTRLIRCSRCHQLGKHNRLTCTAVITD